MLDADARRWVMMHDDIDGLPWAEWMLVCGSQRPAIRANRIRIHQVPMDGN
jgi:hypothetical protein